MKALWSIALIAAAAAAAPAYAACTYPTAPGKIPDGRTATLEEMLAARKAVNVFNDEMTKYMECVDAEAEAQIPATWKQANAEDRSKNFSADDNKKYAEIEKLASSRHNAAYEELTATAARLNEQIGIYKKAQKKD